VEDDPGIISMAMLMRAIDTIAVAKLLRQVFDTDVPVVSGSIQVRVKGDLCVDFAVAGLREDQPDRRSVPAEQDKIDSRGSIDRAGRQGTPARDEEQAVTITVLPGEGHRSFLD
jgi:hypothetical protein